MSAEPTFSTADLRSAAQDYKRDAAHRHKWALGAIETVGRAEGKPKPVRPSNSPFNIGHRHDHWSLNRVAHRDGVAQRYDMLEGAAVAYSDDSSGCNTADEYDEDGAVGPPADAGVMYSFDAAHGPSHGSQILTHALSQAVERFEERETVKLVHNEYDVLDADGELVVVAGTASASSDGRRKGKGKQAASTAIAAAADDEDYEFV